MVVKIAKTRKCESLTHLQPEGGVRSTYGWVKILEVASERRENGREKTKGRDMGLEAKTDLLLPFLPHNPFD